MLSEGLNLTIAVRDESRGDIFFEKSPVQVNEGNRRGESFAMIENAMMSVLIPVSSRAVKGRGDPWTVASPLDIRNNKQLRLLC